MTQQLNGHILTPQGFVRGSLTHAHGRIVALSGAAVNEDVVRGDSDTPILLPGFVDLHIHGGGGADTMDAGSAATTIARQHARHGTTAMLATTMTAPMSDIEAALRALAPAVGERAAGAARLLGVHLEGPYISPDKLGAQPAFARPPSLSEIMALHAIAPIRLVTMAPEVSGNLALIPQLVGAGIRVQIGHTGASYEDTVAALQQGASSFTHLFNAMSPLHHRTPGATGAALAHGQRAEIIPDLLHVHPGAIRAALRAIPELYAVTDATAAAGMPDGEYRLGRQTVSKCMGGVRLPDGTLAGSTLTMDQALRNLVAVGLTLADASARVSTLPARYLALPDRGELVRGAWADIVMLDPATLQLRQVLVEGEQIELAP
ncbi:MAG TPA: N-acetylglucosamine-6-phosphate deacetylase [Rubrivivax sp.]|nr:N-acetylglucosamine-6-phosphate deacetylase [Rubrivivax sp.]